MSEQFGYGTRFYKTVSDDLKSILPDVKSFSPTNLKYMRYFYEMYPDAVICPQVEDELITDANHPQLGDDLQIIFRIQWGHNKIILDKCKGNSAKALFYIRKTIENNWSRDVLLNFLGTNRYGINHQCRIYFPVLLLLIPVHLPVFQSCVLSLCMSRS